MRGDIAWEGPTGTFRGAGNVLYLDLGRGYMDIHIGENSSSNAFKISALYCVHYFHHLLHPLSFNLTSLSSSKWPTVVLSQGLGTCWSLFVKCSPSRSSFLPLCHLLGEALPAAPA